MKCKENEEKELSDIKNKWENEVRNKMGMFGIFKDDIS
jgi:hypothetical protein